jgi:hypothetical protein
MDAKWEVQTLPLVNSNGDTRLWLGDTLRVHLLHVLPSECFSVEIIQLILDYAESTFLFHFNGDYMRLIDISDNPTSCFRAPNCRLPPTCQCQCSTTTLNNETRSGQTVATFVLPRSARTNKWFFAQSIPLYRFVVASSTNGVFIIDYRSMQCIYLVVGDNFLIGSFAWIGATKSLAVTTDTHLTSIVMYRFKKGLLSSMFADFKLELDESVIGLSAPPTASWFSVLTIKGIDIWCTETRRRMCSVVCDSAGVLSDDLFCVRSRTLRSKVQIWKIRPDLSGMNPCTEFIDSVEDGIVLKTGSIVLTTTVSRALTLVYLRLLEIRISKEDGSKIVRERFIDIFEITEIDPLEWEFREGWSPALIKISTSVFAVHVGLKSKWTQKLEERMIVVDNKDDHAHVLFSFSVLDNSIFVAMT